MFDVPSTQSTPEQIDIDNSNSLYRIALQQQPIDNIPRSWMNVPLAFTVLVDQLGLTANTFCGLMNLDRSMFNRHVKAVRQEAVSYSGGGLGVPPQNWLATYSIPVTFAKDATGWGGGGTQMVDYYTDRMCINIVQRMANSPKKYAFTNWMNDIILDYTRNGFVVDQYAAQHDPNITAQLAQLLQENAALKRRADDLKRDLVMYEMNDERYQ